MKQDDPKLRLLDSVSGDEPFVFVSYKHEQWQTVSEVIAQLQLRGCRVWYDRGIPCGERWRGVLKNKIAGCTAFLSFISEDYVRSYFCRKEIVEAAESGKPIIGVYLGHLGQRSTDVPQEDWDAINSALKDSQCFVNFPEMRRETFFREIMSSPVIKPCVGAPMTGSAYLMTETGIDTDIRCGHHFILALDMMSFQYSDTLADTVVQAIRDQKDLHDMLPLTLEASALQFEEELRQIRASSEDFRASYPHEHLFSLTVGKPLPVADEDARAAYMREFCSVMNDLFNSLHNNGITDIHMFYRGPLALLPFVGQAMFNDFRIYYYQAKIVERQFAGYYRVGAQSRI